MVFRRRAYMLPLEPLRRYTSRMDQPSTTPTVELEIRISSEGRPELWVQVGDKLIPLRVTSEQATAAGIALLSAGFLCGPEGPQAINDKKVDSCAVPVIGLRTSLSSNSNWCDLHIRLLGGGEFTLGFPPEGTRECARAMEAAFARLEERTKP